MWSLRQHANTNLTVIYVMNFLHVTSETYPIHFQEIVHFMTFIQNSSIKEHLFDDNYDGDLNMFSTTKR